MYDKLSYSFIIGNHFLFISFHTTLQQKNELKKTAEKLNNTEGIKVHIMGYKCQREPNLLSFALFLRFLNRHISTIDYLHR
jgi:hypothetical protein